MNTAQYHKADQKLHYLSQILAKVNRSFIEKKEDDSHTNLAYDPWNQRILGRTIQKNDDQYRLNLNLVDLSFEMLDQTQNSLWLVGSAGKSIQEVEEQVDHGIKDLGLAQEDWRAPMHYEIPDYGLGKHPIEPLSEVERTHWTYYRALANYSCLNLQKSLATQLEIRIWPHHFDTATLIKINEKLSIGYGLAMKDEMVGEAYFYLSGYPEGFNFNYANFKQGEDWQWKSSEWKGAILPIDLLADEYQAALKSIGDFCLKASDQYFLNLNK